MLLPSIIIDVNSIKQSNNITLKVFNRRIYEMLTTTLGTLKYIVGEGLAVVSTIREPHKCVSDSARKDFQQEINKNNLYFRITRELK